MRVRRWQVTLRLKELPIIDAVAGDAVRRDMESRDQDAGDRFDRIHVEAPDDSDIRQPFPPLLPLVDPNREADSRQGGSCSGSQEAAVHAGKRAATSHMCESRGSAAHLHRESRGEAGLRRRHHHRLSLPHSLTRPWSDVLAQAA